MIAAYQVGCPCPIPAFAEIVDGAEREGGRMDACSPLLRASVQPRGLGHQLDGLGWA